MSTTYLDQFVRCYVDANPRKHRGKKLDRTSHGSGTADDTEAALKEITAPYGGFVLVMDTETTTTLDQRARIGVYELHGVGRQTKRQRYLNGARTREELGVDTLQERGLFYDPHPDLLSTADIATIKAYAREHHLKLRTKDRFVTDVLYKWVYQYRAMLVGHNLVFDLAALATHWSIVQSGEYRNGFALTLCNCGKEKCAEHPRIFTKHLGQYKDMLSFRTTSDSDDEGVQSNWYNSGKFLDTATLGRALLGPGSVSLLNLGKTFKADVVKFDNEDTAITHGGPITPTYLDYAVNDVAATYALYEKERELYRQHGVSRPMHKIYSEASLGKAYFRDIGIPQFMAHHQMLDPEKEPMFPKEVLGYGMVSYYGGRSEVKIRLQPTEVIYTDFKSEYPTVNALMKLQDLWLSERVTTRDSTQVVRAMLASPNLLASLQERKTWERLRHLVKIKPDSDILPVRAQYGDEGHNIGLNHLTGGPIWYTLADVIASTLLTGKAPQVLEAIEMVPSESKVPTKPLKLFGDDKYQIDLSAQDFFTEVINLRTEVKKLKQEGGDYYDSLQLALKLLANSTSYGVFVEVNPDDAIARPVPVTVYGLDTRQERTAIVERPGPYYAGPLGAFITAGGRLLLAIAERLAADRGMGYAFCDTDSMAFARPKGMSRKVFRQHAQDIVSWFTPLSPYKGQPPLLEIEDVNRAITPEGRIHKAELEPLYFVGVSAKRYAVYNRQADGTYRIRKFSSHGVGTWQGMDGYVSPPHIPEPWTDVRHITPFGRRWSYDLWYEAIDDIEAGSTYHLVCGDDWLNMPAFYRVTLSTGHLAKRYSDLPGLRPYAFFTALPGLTLAQARHRETVASLQGDSTIVQAMMGDLLDVPFYAPYAKSVQDLHGVKDEKYHREVTDFEHVTLAECLTRYFMHGEQKAAEPTKIGILDRVHVTTTKHVLIGKESNRVVESFAAETEDEIPTNDRVTTQTYDVPVNRDALTSYPIKDLQAATGVARRTLYDAMKDKEPKADTLRKITYGLTLLEDMPPGLFIGWRDIPPSWLAPKLGISQYRVAQIWEGLYPITDTLKESLVSVLTEWKAIEKTRQIAS